MRTSVFAIGVVLASVSPCWAESLVWNTEKELGAPIELPMGCDPDMDKNCPDRVSYAATSTYGVHMYLTYYEGVRAGIGFGTVPNEQSLFASGQLHPGGYDWGGTETAGKFKPLYVIKRFYDYDGETDEVPKNRTFLVLYRLTRNGQSCVVEVGEASTADAIVARKWAETDQKAPRCRQ